MKRSRTMMMAAAALLSSVLGCGPDTNPAATSQTSAAASGGAAASAAPRAPKPPEEAGRAHAELLGSTLPPDVDDKLLARLRRERKSAEIVALYDQLSWQSFVAVNWPTSEAGEPRPKLGDRGSPAWMQWKEAFDVFLDDGSKPSAWGAPRRLLGGRPTAKTSPLPAGEGAARSTRLVFSAGAKPRRTTADELNQAFASPIWDQNGNIIYYEVILNRPEFEYISKEELYNLDGQIAFSKKNPGKDLDPRNCNHPNKTMVVMPSGTHGTKDEGAVEIKLAWKVLTPSDIEERYLATDGLVPAAITLSGSCASGGLTASIDASKGWKKARLGLVGFHISHKTASAPQWVWSTFEQVDNLAVNELEAARLASQGKTLKPTFNDPSCETCPINVCTAPPQKNQIQRVIPIAVQTAELNREMQGLLRSQGSALQYYELVGTQFPTDADANPTSPRAEPGCKGTDAFPINLPESVANKAGGKPHTAFLTNMTMETFFQAGDQAACNQVENGNCPATLAPGAPVVFATESCIGCHSSASIAVGGTAKTGVTPGTQLTADFSWLLSQKAHWKTN